MLTGVKRLARSLVREHTTPARLGWAVGLGVLVGVTPFYGLHLLICVLVATLLRLNRIVTYLAANISVPVVAPFLAFGSLQLGSLVRNGAWLGIEIDNVTALDLYEVGEIWLLGSLLLGAAIGLPCGLATYVGMSIYRRRRPLPRDPVREALLAVGSQYRHVGRFAGGYVRGKLEHDPVYRQLAERCPVPSPVVDLGCGRGQTSLLLAELQPGVEVIGVDWDAGKIEQARRAATGVAGLRFEVGDIRTVDVPPAATILLFDVLHYTPLDTQNDILARVAAALVPGGYLFVRDLDAGGGWRAQTTVWQERIGTWLGLNRGATLCFRSAAELVDQLETLGLTASLVPSSTDLSLANVLIEARKALPS